MTIYSSLSKNGTERHRNSKIYKYRPKREVSIQRIVRDGYYEYCFSGVAGVPLGDLPVIPRTQKGTGEVVDYPNPSPTLLRVSPYLNPFPVLVILTRTWVRVGRETIAGLSLNGVLLKKRKIRTT